MIKDKIRKISNHSLSKNAFSLGIIQITNYIIPFLVLPYLTRVLGVNGFGSVVLLLSMVQMAYIFTDYGFNLSATYAIAKQRDDQLMVGRQIGAVFTIKLILILIAVVTIFSYGLYSTALKNQYLLLSFCSLSVIFQSFQPIWFFQGIEKMKNITIFSLSSKIVYLGIVFLTVKTDADTPWVFFSLATGNALATLISIQRVYYEGYKILKPSFSEIKSAFKSSSEFFISRIAVSLYTTASAFVVGSVSGVQQAAYYGACEKIYQAGQSVTSPVSQALFPYMAKNGDWRLFFKLIITFCILMIIGCSVVWFEAEELVRFIFGAHYVVATPVLKIFLVCCVINYLAVNFGYPAFAALGRIKCANYSVIFGALFHLTILSVLYSTGNISAINVALSVLATESFVMLVRLSMMFFLIKTHNKILTN